MSDPEFEARCIAAFGTWLKTLADDARALADAVASADAPESVRRPLAGALNYLFKSLDLIDDGIEGVGYLDDAFILRLAAAKAGDDAPEAIKALAADAELIIEFLGDLAPRFDRFMDGLGASIVRGRSVDAIVAEASIREELLGDVRGWANRYSVPPFAAEQKSLVKVVSFLSKKLPE